MLPTAARLTAHLLLASLGAQDFAPSARPELDSALLCTCHLQMRRFPMTTAVHMGGDTRWARMSGLLVADGWGCHLGCLWLGGACAGCPAAGQAHWVGNAAQAALQRGRHIG